MKLNKKHLLFLIAGIIILLVGVRFLDDEAPQSILINENQDVSQTIPIEETEEIIESYIDHDLGEDTDFKDLTIVELTAEDIVIDYVRTHKKLPDYYITKKEAQKLGWVASKGNLCDVLPGRAIGGDHFGNYESRLPKSKGRKYTEADINYDCGRRDAQRLIFSNDGLIFITKDHYNTFEEK